jgi:hypothetical protein
MKLQMFLAMAKRKVNPMRAVKAYGTPALELRSFLTKVQDGSEWLAHTLAALTQVQGHGTH